MMGDEPAAGAIRQPETAFLRRLLTFGGAATLAVVPVALTSNLSSWDRQTQLSFVLPFAMVIALITCQDGVGPPDTTAWKAWKVIGLALLSDGFSDYATRGEVESFYGLRTFLFAGPLTVLTVWATTRAGRVIGSSGIVRA